MNLIHLNVKVTFSVSQLEREKLLAGAKMFNGFFRHK